MEPTDWQLWSHNAWCNLPGIAFQKRKAKNCQLLSQTAHGQGTGQRVPTSPHAPTQPPWNTRTRSRPLGQQATPPTSRPRSLGSARTDGTWSKGLGTKQLAGRLLRTSACGIPTTPSSPQISSASSHIATRCIQRCFPSSLFPSQPTDEPNDSGANYAFVWDNLRTPLDQDIVYPCKTNMRVENTTEWKSEVGNYQIIIEIIINHNYHNIMLF